MTDTAAPNSIEVLKPSTRKEWLSWRRQDVTASQIAAVLGLHPYCSRLELFLTKSGRKVPDDDIESAAMIRGRMLEGLAFKMAANKIQEEYPAAQLEHHAAPIYYRDRNLRIGCTPDATVDHPKLGRGIIQLKSAEPSIYRKHWLDGEPPLWIALQALTEAKLLGASWAAVGVLRVGHAVEFDLIDIPLSDRAWDALTEAVKDFWHMVDLGIAPTPDYAVDGELIARLLGPSDGTTIDLSGDNELAAALHDREELKALASAMAKRLEVIDAQIKFKIGEHEAAIVGDFRVTLKTHNVKEHVVKAGTRRPINVKRIRGKAPVPDDDQHANE